MHDVFIYLYMVYINTIYELRTEIFSLVSDAFPMAEHKGSPSCPLPLPPLVPPLLL